MNIIAFCLSIAGALLSIFQPVSVPGLFAQVTKVSFFEFSKTTLEIASEIKKNPSIKYMFIAPNVPAWIWSIAIVFCLAFLGIWGGIRAGKRKGGTIPLAINAISYLGMFISLNYDLTTIVNNITMKTTWVSREIGLWGILYLIALICRLLDKKPTSEANPI